MTKPRIACCPLKSYGRLIAASPWYHKLFLALVATQVVVTVAERCILLAETLQSLDVASNGVDNRVRQQVWFFVILVVSALFIGYFGIHAILSVNAFEVITFFLTSLALIIRLIVEYTTNAAMYGDLKWKKYKAIGAEVATRQLYLRFELFSAVKQLDLQFSIVTVLTGVVFFSALDSLASGIALGMAVIILVIEVVWERCGDYAVSDESELAMYAFWVLSIFLPAFMVNVAVDYFRNNDLLASAENPSVIITIAVFAVLTIFNRLLTVWCSVTLYRSFGERYRGLRRIFTGDRLLRFERGRVRQTQDTPAAPSVKVLNPMQLSAEASSVNLAVEMDGGNVVEIVDADVRDWDPYYEEEQAVEMTSLPGT